MAITKNTRYIPLFDEIKNHVFQWAIDQDWKKLPKSVGVALTQVMNELKIHEALKATGASDDREDNTDQKAVRAFIGMFKKRFLELADFEYQENPSTVDIMNLRRVIQTITDEGGNYVEYIEWFFNDFCTLESSKKLMPPSLRLLCSNTIVSKFLYAMKDSFRLRKEDLRNQSTRNALIQIALPLAERTKDKELAAKTLEFSNQKITVTKFYSLLKAFAVKLNDPETIAKCDEIDKLISENK